MLGTFQQSNLRIEVEASETAIRDSLLCVDKFRQWLLFQQFSQGIPESLQEGTTFMTWLGPISVCHQVEVVTPNSLRLLLSRGIDGYHQWHWGEGWIQSHLEGVSLLPLGLGQTISLYRLRSFLEI